MLTMNYDTPLFSWPGWQILMPSKAVNKDIGWFAIFDIMYNDAWYIANTYVASLYLRTTKLCTSSVNQVKI